MMYTDEQWYSLGLQLYEVITKEFEDASGSKTDLPQRYPKLVIAYEFFRLWRGEAFNSIRPATLGEYQKELYTMEDDLKDKLEGIKKILDAHAENVQQCMRIYKEIFTV